MKNTLIILLFLSVNAFSQVRFSEKTTSKSKVKMTFNNNGIFGNAYRGYRNGSGLPSCVYPDSSAIEHIFEGGFWIGGLLNGVPHVSTSCTQDFQGGFRAFEFTAKDTNDIVELSNQDTSNYFDSSAIAAQEFRYSVTDKYLIIPGTTIPIRDHTPLSVDTDVKLLNFLVEENHSIVFVELIAINSFQGSGNNQIDDLYFGIHLKAVIRNINVTPAGSGGVAFYDKGANGFLKEYGAAYAYDYSGDVGSTNTYVSQVVLGVEDKNGVHHPKIDSSVKIHYNVWNYNSTGSGVFNAPSSDAERFQKLSNGIQDDLCWTVNDVSCGGGTYQTQLNANGNRSDLVSIGPLNDFVKGDSIVFTFAFVFANKIDDGNAYTDNTAAQMKALTDRLTFAQTLYNGEDVNFNGILDDGEDKDGNGKISRYYVTPTGLSELHPLEKLRFQNPNYGKFRIDFSNQSERIQQIDIFNLSGQLVYTKKINSKNSLEVELSDLPRGTYFLRVTSRSYQQRVEKLIKI